MNETKFLEYLPFNSCTNTSFWHKLTQIKLDIDKLNEGNRDIWGYFSNVNIQTQPIFEVDSTSFNNDSIAPNINFAVRGKLYNKNTIEQFKSCDKTELIQGEGKVLWDNIVNGDCIKNPSLLNTFFILSYADLKKYHFYYWFAFPTPADINVTLNNINNLGTLVGDEKLLTLYENYEKLDLNQKPFFIIKAKESEVYTLESLIKINDANNLASFSNLYFAYTDPCDDKKYSGWTVKNYLALLLHHCPILHGKRINLLAFRLVRKGSKLCANSSLIFDVTLPSFSGDVCNTVISKSDGGWIGWERNERGKLGPRLSNLKTSLDPKSLAETSVDLNLKLMKWRLLPEIDLDKIKNTKCLILGSGTLGCSVARVLLGWGVRNISFVDNSTVSSSNPVRQSLFTYDDATQNKPKAQAAADNLKNVFPGVNSKGHQFSIPMPGHPIGESLLQTTKDAVDLLTKLISEHDIIFLLMDSRESRWLPTLLACHYNKIVINAALGFDTYLVMRHGMRSVNLQNDELKIPDGFKMIPGNELGCYFCNDVTAPGNSLKDRTLDQQCTVTRPGVSQIAGAIAVELAISLTQHKLGAFAPAFYKQMKASEELDMDNECCLGLLPHSIRGFLSSFTHVLPATERYKQCIACSETILLEYGDKGFDFLLLAFNSSKFLEDLTGLTELYNVDQEEVWELPDSDDE